MPTVKHTSLPSFESHLCFSVLSCEQESKCVCVCVCLCACVSVCVCVCVCVCVYVESCVHTDISHSLHLRM